MADRTPESSASAVRDAAHLIAAAEELLAISPDPVEAATYIGTIADAAKALRANHLADALEHVRYRATRSAETRRMGWLISEPIEGRLHPVEPERAALEQAAEALRLTAEFIGPEGLPSLGGWSWFDALEHAREVLGWDQLPHDWRRPDQDAPSEPEAEGRAARHEAAVDALVSEPDEPHTNDPEVLRARVHGDDDG